MKRRVRKIANFFAFNLLFFALYLNFVHKDKSNIVVTPVTQQAGIGNNGSGTGTVLVDNPEQYVKKATAAAPPRVQAQPEAQQTGDNALRLSIN